MNDNYTIITNHGKNEERIRAHNNKEIIKK